MTGEGVSLPCPRSLFFELMDFTSEVSTTYHVTPFDVLKEDKDLVIMLINYYIEKGKNETNTTRTAADYKRNTEQRILVNDKTATGGWY